MLNFRRYVVLSSSIVLFSSTVYTMRVEEHPTSHSLYDMLLRQIASHEKLRTEFNIGPSQSSKLDSCAITYIAETLRKYNQYPVYTHERLTQGYTCYTAGSFNHSESTITLGSSNGMLNNIDTTTGDLSSIVLHLRPIQSLAYSSDDTRIITIARNHSVSIYDALSGIRLAAYSDLEIVPDHAMPRLSSTISLDGSLIAVQRANFATELWNVGIEKLTLRKTLATNESARQLCLSPDASQLFVIKSASGELYDTTTGKLLFTIPYYMEPNTTFSRNGAWIVAACKRMIADAFTNYILKISTTKSDRRKPIQKKFKINMPNTAITALAPNNDCTRIALHLALPGISHYRLNIMNTETTPASLTHSFRSPCPARKLILSSDEVKLAALGEKSIVLWDFCLIKLITKLVAKHGEFLLKACEAAWDKDGKYSIDNTDEHYQDLIRNVSLFKLNAKTLFTESYPVTDDPATDEESASPKRARRE